MTGAGPLAATGLHETVTALPELLAVLAHSKVGVAGVSGLPAPIPSTVDVGPLLVLTPLSLSGTTVNWIGSPLELTAAG